MFLVSCIFRQEIKAEIGCVSVVSDGKRAFLYSSDSISGAEISFDSSVDEQDLSFPESVLKIIRKTDSGLIASIARISSDFSEGEFLLSVKTPLVPEDLILAADSVLVETSGLETASSDPFPDGISVKEAFLDCSSEETIEIQGKNLTGFCGLDFSIFYDLEAFTIDLEKGNNGVTPVNTMQDNLTIVKHYPGELSIASAFPVEISITDETIYLIHVITSDTEHKSLVELDGEVMDGEANPVPTGFFGAEIEIGGPRLLGDFDSNEIVDIMDFINFARNYGRSEEDDRFEGAYDIAPAVDMYGGIWGGIYDRSDPDGNVDITDFIIFARNYGKKKPYDPPTAPVNVSPANESSNQEIDVRLEWTCASDEESSLTYDVYFGSNLPFSLLAEDYSDTVFHLENLDNSTTYYWKIIAKDQRGNTTEGDIWSFTTKEMKVFFYEGFEEVNFLSKGWKVSGNSLPFIQSREVFEGNYSLSFLRLPEENDELQEFSGSIEIALSLPEDAYISFYRKVTGFYGDFLSFSIDGVEMGMWSSMYDFWGVYDAYECLVPEHSDLEWREVIRRVPSGTHIFKWKFEGYRCTQVNESDSAWIDEVKILNSASLGEVVAFPDEFVNGAIRRQLGKSPSEVIREKEVQDISTLIIDSYQPSGSFVDIKREMFKTSCQNQSDFDIESYTHVDLTGIEKCKDLIVLYVGGTVSDLNPLRGCEKTKTVLIRSSENADFSPLENLEGLWGLAIEGGTLDLSTISDIGNLELLLLSNINPLSSVDSLRRLNSTQFLVVSNCGLESADFLREMLELKIADISNNNISEIPDLSGNETLLVFGANENQISDISFISGNDSLISLSIARNELEEISSISGLRSLESITFSENQISDISPISGLSKLKSANLAKNLISDLPSFENLPLLSYLNLSYNRICDISVLAQTLNMQNGGFVDLLYNMLNVTPGSDDMQNIAALQERGIHVNYYPQAQAPVPNNPSPFDQETGVATDVVLSWECGDNSDSLLYDLCLTTFPFSPSAVIIVPLPVAENLSDKYYDPGELIPWTTYYWRVGSKFEGGSVTWGPQWCFTTTGE